jgi:hypothetical protein
MFKVRIPTHQLHLQPHHQSHRHAPHGKRRALLDELIGLVIGKESVQGLHRQLPSVILVKDRRRDWRLRHSQNHTTREMILPSSYSGTKRGKITIYKL